MTTLTPQPSVTEEPPSAAQTAVNRWRTWRGVVLFLVVLIGITLILAAIHPRTETDAYLDPSSAKRDGSRALAQILARQGIDVQITRTTADAVSRLYRTPGALLAVVRDDRLFDNELRQLAQAPGDRLLIEPSTATLKALDPTVRKASESFHDVSQPQCGLPAATAAGSVALGTGSTTYEITGQNAIGCYPDDKMPQLVRSTLPDGRTATAIGSGLPFTNQRLAKNGNAALGLDLFGARRTVIWLMPDLHLPQATPTSSDTGSPGQDNGDHNGNGSGNGNGNGGNPPTNGGNPGGPGSGSAADKTFWDMVPDGVYFAIGQLAVAGLFIALWRGRRLGPVVAERLPVIVRSAETVEGRARLYRGRRARGRAADALRAGTRERLVPRLGIARRAAQDPSRAQEIVRAVAARTEWDETTIGWALYGPEPADDAELVRLSDFLSDLESRVLDA